MSGSPSKEQRVLDGLKAKLGAKLRSESVKPNRVSIEVEPGDISDAAKASKELGFDQVISVAGTDFPKDNQIEVMYHVASLRGEKFRAIVLALSSRVPRSDPKIVSLYPVWRSCDWHERETHEMLGVVFEGHPELGRVLLPEDWNEIPPLRKDYVLPGRD